VVGVRLIVEPAHLAIAADAIEVNRLLEGAVGLEPDHPRPTFPGCALERHQEPSPDPEPADFRRHPHALELGGCASVELDGAASHRTAAQARDQQGAMRRDELVRVGWDAERRVEALIESPVELLEVLVDAPARVGCARALGFDAHHRGGQQAVHVPHRGDEPGSLLCGQGFKEFPRDRVRPPVERRPLGAAFPGEAHPAHPPVLGSRLDDDQPLALERLQDPARVARVEAESSPQLADVCAVAADLPEDT